MIQVKISAENERLIRKAKTEAELRGAVDLVIELLAQAENTRTAKKANRATNFGDSPYNWKKVITALRDTLGDDLFVPPYPDSQYCQTIYRHAKMNNLDADAIKRLAEKVKESTLKPPVSALFAVSNAARILGGAYDRNAARLDSSTPASRFRGRTPLPSLPDD